MKSFSVLPYSYYITTVKAFTVITAIGMSGVETVFIHSEISINMCDQWSLFAY